MKSDSKVVLDPDLIDLTMIPPPMTPDEVNLVICQSCAYYELFSQDGASRLFPSSGASPPTPFADRQSLEAELKALEKDIGYLERFRRQHSEETYGYNIRESLATVTSTEDNLNSDGEETSLNSLTLPDLVTEEGRRGPSLAAMRHMRAEDIDMFIQNMTVPPPPSGQRRTYKETSPVVELTKEDISAFIIPPPPGQQHQDQAGKMDREVLELRLPKDQLFIRGNEKISPKIASLQERISQFNVQEAQGRGKELGLSLVKDKYGYPLQPPGVSPEREPEPSTVLRGGVQSKKELFMRGVSSPDQPSELPPPPPPPRSSVPRQMSGSATLGRPGSRPAPQSYQFGNNLVRSNSQEELITSGRHASRQPLHHPVRAVTAKVNGKLSSSSEDLDLKRSPISPSKLSMTSSSDSISSTASVNTVKSASPHEENPPSLPPRLSPTKVNIKPPIPPLASPENTDFSLKIVSNSPFRNGHLGGQANGKGPHSPSPSSPVQVPGSPKPVLPSRLSKPSSPTKPAASLSPTKSSPGRSLPQIPGSAARQLQPGAGGKLVKPAAPTPPGSPKPGLASRSSSSPQPQRKVPQEPAKNLTATERLTGGRKLPIPPPSSGSGSGVNGARVNGAPGTGGGLTNGSHSPGNARYSSSPVRTAKEPGAVPASPKSILKNNGHVNGHRIPNGHHPDLYTNTEFGRDDSLEGTSVDDPESDNDALKAAGRLIVFKKAEEVVATVVQNIRESRTLCTAGDMSQRNEAKFVRSKELLTTESRQFVTASKLFVKSATESEGQLMECLNHCVHMIDRIGE